MELLAGILNSTLVVLSKYQFGRPVGVEGNLKTEIIDINMMLVPDPKIASIEVTDRIIQAFKKMTLRKPLQFLSERRMRGMAYTQSSREHELAELPDVSELDMRDRKDLDDAVLELIGMSSPKQRNDFIDELYIYFREYYELTRQKEEKAIANKKKAKRRTAANPKDIALQIYQEITKNTPLILRHYDTDFLNKSKPFDTYDLPEHGIPSLHQDLLLETGVMFKKGKKSIAIIETKNSAQDELIVLVSMTGLRGLVRIPRNDKDCDQLYQEYSRFLRKRESVVRELIDERTSDEEMKDDIYDALIPLIMQGH